MLRQWGKERGETLFSLDAYGRNHNITSLGDCVTKFSRSKVPLFHHYINDLALQFSPCHSVSEVFCISYFRSQTSRQIGLILQWAVAKLGTYAVNEWSRNCLSGVAEWPMGITEDQSLDAQQTSLPAHQGLLFEKVLGARTNWFV